MVWVALVYAVVGTWLTHLVGRPLASLSFRQQRVEADFRYALVRVRENMESIALYRGEAGGKRHAAAAVRGGDRQLVPDHDADEAAELAGVWLCPGRRWSFPFVVAAPALFLRRHATGRPDADGRRFRPGAKRDVMVRRAPTPAWPTGAPSSNVSPRSTARSSRRGAETDGGFVPVRGTAGWHGAAARCDHEPAGRDETAGARRSDADRRAIRWCVTGRSGSGKSTLFRVLAGIWPFGQGEVEVPSELVLPAAAPVYPAWHTCGT